VDKADHISALAKPELAFAILEFLQGNKQK
jgi:hypothetical protein